ncbi:radical SAM domain protein [Alloprevotella tannerae ATCC 51259]|uniref:Radical SAM domain protein n=2 Tax=Alloprevotella tannerae TaxID=76122 RepID=C9LEK4_9BACT|nr:radical SAM domain protein [Alloprevotella tannerae ATCC 51259]
MKRVVFQILTIFVQSIINRISVMSTILFPAPIFGPVHSRRLGVSLGVNLMPADGKLCSFDCVYCECGFNKPSHSGSKRPSRVQVKTDLEKQLQKMVEEGRLPDVITFAGNGEPTLHPDFAGIIDDTIALRDRYCPQAKVSVLSNATMAFKPDVRDALLKVDNNILKLDTVDPDFIQLVDRPVGKFDVNKIIDDLAAFHGKVIVQTMFLKGKYQGRDVDNTGDYYVTPWLKALEKIKPEAVMVYTIDRETPAHELLKATPAELDAIVARIKALGIEASASY